MKPKVSTRKYLDWVDLKPYLQKKHPKLKLDKCIGLFAEHGDFHNGCFIPIEQDPGQYEPEIEDLTAVIFKEFPDAVQADGTIDLYIWW
jgi:hypothetical protein